MKEIAKNFLELGVSVCSAVIPENAMAHFGKATKEIMLGIVEMIDEEEKKLAAQEKKSQKIDITE